MKIGKREKNGIIIHFIFYSLLTVGLLFYIISNLVPNILSIEEQKKETKNTFNNIVKIEKSGLSYKEFININNEGKQSRVVAEILNSMSEEFYTDNLTNTSSKSYKYFLGTISDGLNSAENRVIIDLQKKQISKILPSYSEKMINFGDDKLTDYKFINYIESIIESFGFISSNSIGINKVILLEDFAVGKDLGEGLDSNIYYIPLKLNLKGTKSGVIEFLYFIENLGNIDIDDKEIIITKNFDFLSKNGIAKVLEGDRYSSDYNIFEHQIADISKISINNYIDSSYLSRGNKNFIDFIIDTQGDEKFEINVDLMFYVKGLPTYKIEEFIKKVINDYQKITQLVVSDLKNPELKIVERIKLNKYNKTIKQFKKEIDSIRKKLNKKEDLETIYKNTAKIDEVLKPMFKSLQK